MNAGLETGDQRRCANCGTPISGRFCSSCAQDSSLQRISLLALVKRGFDQLQELDAPFVRTLIGLTLRPGAVATEYVAGARRRYTNPIKYALIICAAMVIGIKWDPFGRARYFPEIEEGEPPATAIVAELMLSFIEYTQLTMIVSAPLLALLLWMFFPRTERNFAEQCALVFFVLGHVALFQTPMMMLGALGSQGFSVFLALMQVAWLSWAAVPFYGGRPWLTFLRACLPHVVYFLIVQTSIVIYLIVRYGTQALLTPE